MRFFISTIGVLASLILLASSASMNYLFMYSLGKTEMESHVLSAASVGADVLKASLPFFLSWAYLNGRYLFSLASLGLFACLIGLSLLSASSFILGSRLALSGSQDELNADYRAAQVDLKVATSAFDGLPTYRARNIVAGDLERQKRNRRWVSTSACTDATVQASILYCQGIVRLQSELTSAVERDRLERKISRLKQEISRFRGAGAGKDGDPQVGLLARVFRIERDGLTLWINAFIAMVIELGSDFGLYFATSWGVKPTRQKKTHNGMERNPEQLSIEAVADSLTSYCVDRLHPSERQVSVSVMDIYADYVAWSEGCRRPYASVAAFLDSFADIAEEAGLCMKDTQCQNVRVGPRLDTVAA